MKIEQAFSKRFRMAMHQAHVSVRDLSELTGISKGSISCYMRGRYIPTRKYLNRIASALNVDPMWLLAYEDDEKDEVSYQRKSDELDEAVRRELIKAADFIRKQKDTDPITLMLDQIRYENERYHVVGMEIKDYMTYYDMKSDTFIIYKKEKKQTFSLTVCNSRSRDYAELMKEYRKSIDIAVK